MYLIAIILYENLLNDEQHGRTVCDGDSMKIKTEKKNIQWILWSDHAYHWSYYITLYLTLLTCLHRNLKFKHIQNCIAHEISKAIVFINFSYNSERLITKYI